MGKYSFIDIIQRKVNSILFRIVLLFYATVIIATNDNIFSIWLYIPLFFVYFIVYLILIGFSYGRLANDSIFIVLVLLGKSPYDIYNFIFIILPIINSINFSGKKKSILLYVFTLIEFVIVYYSYSHSIIDFNRILKLFLLIVFLGIINWYSHLRAKVKIFREELFEVVDRFYLDKEQIKKPYKIYKKFIEVIHQNIKHDLIQDLYCFNIRAAASERVIIINGTSFVWTYQFTQKDFLTRLREKKTLFNEPVTIDDTQIKKNLLIYINIDSNEYAFLFSLKKDIPIYYQLIGFFRTIEPPLSKMAQILLSERKIFEIKQEEIEKLSEKSQYVNRANNMMHFIRNRLSPFANLSKMLGNLSSIPDDKVEDFKKLLFEQNTRSQIELKNIIFRADDMLEKSKNPFFYKTLKEVSIEKTFTILKRSFSFYFPDEEIIVDIKPQSIRRNVKLNEEGFEIFISDWLNNVKKYKKSIIKCNFTATEDKLFISFFNDHFLPKEEIDQLLNDLKSNDRNEIIKRTTHGVFIIKSILDDMNISYDVLYDNALIEFKIELNISENGNSNI